MTIRLKAKTTKKATDSKSVVSSRRPNSSRKLSVYGDYAIWDSKKRPKWHPVKKMRYVFFRMIGGCTVTDALREIRWNAADFWHLIDLKRNNPFREEYHRAKRLQGRAFADSVVVIAEGRDVISRSAVRKITKIVEKGLRRAGKQKNRSTVKMIVEGLMARMDENDHRILGRNKLQIEAAKWIAKTSNPAEFADASKLSLGASPGEGAPSEVATLRIEFVGPDGKVVKP